MTVRNQDHFREPAAGVGKRGRGGSRKAVGPRPSANGDGGPDGFHLTDVGNAQRFVKRHGRDLRHVHAWKAWLVWDGRRWAQDQTGEVVRRLKQTQAVLNNEAASRIKDLQKAGDDDKADRSRLEELVKHVLKWEDARAISRSIDLARSEHGIPVVPEVLDQNPMLLNVRNGTIDLRTGELRPHRREDLITKLAPVDYDPSAACQLWLRFLDRVMDGNQDLIRYLQRVVGYGLTGDVSEQSLWFFHGAGANGKSTFLGTILAMLGDYAMQAVSELLMAKNNESHPTERADLFGRRFVATIEVEEGKRMAEALMKQLTGGDKIRARWMKQNFFEFDPTHKIILAANHKPNVRDANHGSWRRIKLVPFTVTIPDEEKDRALPEKLKAELPGILAWAVQGCLAWQRHGLGEPDEVRLATAAYQREQDAVQAFLDECCVLQPDMKTKSSSLLESYLKWSGDKFMTRVGFHDRLKEKGFESKRGTGGGFYWHGIGLLPEGRVKASEYDPGTF